MRAFAADDIGLSGYGAPPLGDRVGALLRRIAYRRVGGADDMRGIFRLRYDAYLKEGSIAPNADRMVRDDFDEAPNARHFAILLDGRLAGAIRLHLVGVAHRTSPAMAIFPEALSGLVDAGDRVLDPNRFVTAPDCRSEPLMPYAVLRLPIAAARVDGIRWTTATVRAEHMGFYHRTVRARTLCPPRVHPLLFKPCALMLCDHDVTAAHIAAGAPFFGPWPGDEELMS